MTNQEANEVLFPFINDAPCLNELVISDGTLKRCDFMIKLMEKSIMKKSSMHYIHKERI